MPLYEFSCEDCGARFEELVPVGTESVTCRECGGERTRRAYSAPRAPMKLVKSPAEARRQEGRNRVLRETTKARFKESRKRAREARRNRPGGEP